MYSAVEFKLIRLMLHIIPIKDNHGVFSFTILDNSLLPLFWQVNFSEFQRSSHFKAKLRNVKSFCKHFLFLPIVAQFEVQLQF